MNKIDWKDLIDKTDDNTYFVQFINKDYKPVSKINYEIEDIFHIQKELEKVGKHKVPDCIVVNKTFSLVIYDTDSNNLKENYLMATKFLSIMCKKYNVKKLIFTQSSIHGVCDRKQFIYRITGLFKGIISRLNMQFC